MMRSCPLLSLILVLDLIFYCTCRNFIIIGTNSSKSKPNAVTSLSYSSLKSENYAERKREKHRSCKCKCGRVGSRSEEKEDQHEFLSISRNFRFNGGGNYEQDTLRFVGERYRIRSVTSTPSDYFESHLSTQQLPSNKWSS